MAAELDAFQTGAEFISFDAPPSTSASAAGPSRLPSPSTGQVKTNGKGKGRARDDLDSEDERLLAARNGRGKVNGVKNGKTKHAEKRARTDGEDTGPKNLKEERRAAERHAPWADAVDWERCRDPAEM